MFENTFSLRTSLDFLHRLCPIQGAVVIGAGMGQGPWFDLFVQQKIKDIALIDGNAQCVSQLEKIYAEQQSWQIHPLVLSDQQGEGCFHLLSSSLESGLLSAEEIKDIWPNIKTREKQVCEVLTLEGFLQSRPSTPNWLIVDCLPAWQVLGGENSALQSFDVIVVRSVSDGSAVSAVDSGQLKAFFQQEGYACIASESERNPALVHDVYVKDIACLSFSIGSQAESLRRVEIEKIQVCEKLKSAEQQAAEQISKLQGRVEELEEAGQKSFQEWLEKNEQLIKQRDEQAKRVADLHKALDGQAELAKEQQKQNEKLSRRCEELSNLATDRQVEIERLNRVREEEEQQIALQSTSLETRVDHCLSAEDIHVAIEQELDSDALTETEKINFLFMLSDAFFSKGDKLTALHFLHMLLDREGFLDVTQKERLVSGLITQGRADLASHFVISELLKKGHIDGLDVKEQKAITNAYLETVKTYRKISEHGHDLLLDYLETNISKYKKEQEGRKPVMIEIGTTRENVPGQGSTRKIAEFCHKNGLVFITVDMDSHNTRLAQEMFAQQGFEAQAITAKGEDFLRAYEGTLDFVFLDAYDFDHGGHSALRQSRYEKFLGERINDTACHQMHLECAQIVNAKLAGNGLVCVDDTWFENDVWTAKGTLAMPYLLEQEFVLVEARNRAAILKKIEQ